MSHRSDGDNPRFGASLERLRHCWVTADEHGRVPALLLEWRETPSGSHRRVPSPLHPTAPAEARPKGTVTCNLGTLNAGDSVNIRVEVTAEEAQDINDVATVTSTTTDPDLSNNQAGDGIEVIAASDLSITKTGDLNGTAGTNITYTIGVDNAGPSTATAVKVVDVLPAGVTFVSATPDVGSFTLNGQVLTWNIGNLTVAAPVREIDITVKIQANATGQLENTA